jgi:hypothetical protein
VVEWAFGQLKARFPSLKKLGMVSDMGDIYQAIEAMMVIHNICYDLGNSPDGFCIQLDDIEDDSRPSDDLDDEEQDSQYWHSGQGLSKPNAKEELDKDPKAITRPL